MMVSNRNPAAPVHGLYERLVSEGEFAEVNRLTALHMALVSQPSQAQRREHLVAQLTAQLPELLDAISSPLVGNDEQARAELKLIAHLLREARLWAKQDSAPILPMEPLQLLHAIHEPNASPTAPETGLRHP